jgi:hypothetical protein
MAIEETGCVVMQVPGHYLLAALQTPVVLGGAAGLLDKHIR